MARGRRKFARFMEGSALVLLVLDGLLCAGVFVWLRNSIDMEAQSYRAARRQIIADRNAVARLRQLKVEEPEASGNLDRFLQEHIPSRREAYSHAARMVRELASRSGVHQSGLTYKLDSEKNEPLDRLGMTIDVEGQFASLMNFAHSLETTPEFVVVREISMANTEGGSMALRVSADLYISQ